MVLNDSVQLLYAISATFLVILMVCFLIFSRTSIKYIERKMKEENIEDVWWDRRGWGFRISMYILILTKGKPAKKSLLNDKAILNHARLFDKVLAKVISISFLLFLIPSIYLEFFNK